MGEKRGKLHSIPDSRSTELMKTLLLCDGTRPTPETLQYWRRECGLFVAVDGGGNVARELGLIPDLVIGDLDSYRAEPDENIEVILDPDQETNDLEKALQYVLKRGGREAIVFGATGKRLDHTLKNLSVLKRFNPHFRSIRFIDPYMEIRLIPKEFTATLPVGTDVSLFPLSGRVTGVETRGLMYPLSGEILENGVRDGSSNRTVEKRIEIRYREGDLLFLQTLNSEPR